MNLNTTGCLNYAFQPPVNMSTYNSRPRSEPGTCVNKNKCWNTSCGYATDKSNKSCDNNCSCSQSNLSMCGNKNNSENVNLSQWKEYMLPNTPHYSNPKGCDQNDSLHQLTGETLLNGIDNCMLSKECPQMNCGTANKKSTKPNSVRGFRGNHVNQDYHQINRDSLRLHYGSPLGSHDVIDQEQLTGSLGERFAQNLKNPRHKMIPGLPSDHLQSEQNEQAMSSNNMETVYNLMKNSSLEENDNDSEQSEDDEDSADDDSSNDSEVDDSGADDGSINDNDEESDDESDSENN
jgi:hypothetical protein